ESARKAFQVRERVEGHAALADFAGAEVVVGVVAVKRREVERGGESGLSVREEVLEALVRVSGGAEAGELAHGPEPAAITGRMDAAGVRKFAGPADLVPGLLRPRQ